MGELGEQVRRAHDAGDHRGRRVAGADGVQNRLPRAPAGRTSAANASPQPLVSISRSTGSGSTGTCSTPVRVSTRVGGAPACTTMAERWGDVLHRLGTV